MRVLLTGFEPFGGSAVNPSQKVVESLAQGRSRLAERGIDLRTLILAVEAKRGPSALLRAIDRVKPDAVMCLGESGRATAITIERVFINLADYRIADNAGTFIANKPIARGGPAAYFTTLPFERLRDAVRDAGVAAELSLSAGAFLCNHVAYALAHHLAKRDREIPAGFVHLPRLPEQVRGQRGKPSMPLDDMVRAVETMLQTMTPKSRRTSGQTRRRRG